MSHDESIYARESDNALNQSFLSLESWLLKTYQDAARSVWR